MNKWCVLCGGDYNPTVLECVDCNVPLVDRQPLRVDDVVAEGEEQLLYDFEDIANIQRLKVDELFWENGIAHAWDGANLVVRPEDEDQADQLLEEADEGDFLDRDVEQISYELDEWDDTHRERLVEALEGSQIEHAWDANGELVVLAEDEDRVDSIIEVLEDEWDGPELTIDDIERVAEEDEAAVAARGNGEADYDGADDSDDGGESAAEDDIDDASGGSAEDDEDEAEDDGPAPAARRRGSPRGQVDDVSAGELLSEVFVAADRLMSDPSDSEGVLGYVDAASAIESMALPFGFSPAVWRDMQHRILELRESIEGDVEDEVILEQATGVRNQLRAYV